MQRKHVWLIGVPAVLLVLLIAAPALHVPPQYDLLAKIRHIHSNNDQINTVNGSIAQHMGEISDLAGTTQRIATDLHGLQQGLSGQQASLANLNELSVQEEKMSTDFLGLATRLKGDLGGIGHSSDAQQQSLAEMKGTAANLATLAGQVQQENATIAGKLKTAAGTSATVARNMP